MEVEEVVEDEAEAEKAADEAADEAAEEAEEGDAREERWKSGAERTLPSPNLNPVFLVEPAVPYSPGPGSFAAPVRPNTCQLKAVLGIIHRDCSCKP